MQLWEKVKLLASQAINSLFFGGEPDESLSAKAWRQRSLDPKLHRRIDRWFGLGHCKRVFEAQERRIEDRKAPL